MHKPTCSVQMTVSEMAALSGGRYLSNMSMLAMSYATLAISRCCDVWDWNISRYMNSFDTTAPGDAAEDCFNVRSFCAGAGHGAYLTWKETASFQTQRCQPVRAGR